MVATTRTTMHTKSDSELTSIEASSTPPRSPRRPLYYVQSPSHELEKMSYGSSPFGSPAHHHFQSYYHCSPVHHSRESSTSRMFGDSLKNPRSHNNGWRRMSRKYDDVGLEEGEGEGEEGGEEGGRVRFYVVWFVVVFVVVFGGFCLVLWGASLGYKPKIVVKSIAFENFNVQAGMDGSGVPTDMLTMNSTVRIFYRNPSTFFGVHVTATPLELHYLDLKVASGHMEKFYQSRKSQRIVTTAVSAQQVPLYGGLPLLSSAKGRTDSMFVPLNLTFVMRSRAYILGRLVKPKFYLNVFCEVTLRGNHLGKPLNLTKSESCVYR